MKHFFQHKPLSWSSLSSFKYSQEQWARKYVDAIIDPPNAEMLFGNEVGGKLASDPSFMPQVLRYSIFEKKLLAPLAQVDEGLLGFFDSFDPTTKHFYEYKTSSNKDRWTQKSAQDHGQILFYKFLIWKNYGVPPEQIRSELFYIPVQKGGDFQMSLADEPVQSFVVQHTTVELMKFMKDVQKTYQDMTNYADVYTQAKCVLPCK